MLRLHSFITPRFAILQIVHCRPISPRSVPHSEEAGRQTHLWRHSGGPALGKFGLVRSTRRRWTASSSESNRSLRRYDPSRARASIQYLCRQGTILNSASMVGL